MIITSLVQGKKENFVNVYLDDEFAASITKSTLAECALYKDKSITASTWGEILEKDMVMRLFLKAIAYISIRPRSQNEVEVYLNKKAERLVAESLTRLKIIQKVITKLIDQNLINDAVFASWWLESRKAFRTRSSAEIRRELQLKHVASEVINEVIGAGMNSEDQIVDIRASARKKLRIEDLAFLRQDKKTYEKVAQYFIRRGFSYNLIKQALLEDDNQ